jgi:hypothetical protein
MSQNTPSTPRTTTIKKGGKNLLKKAKNRLAI